MMMKIENLANGQIRLEIDPGTEVEKKFCTAIANLNIFRVLFILSFCDSSSNQAARLQITTGNGVLRSLEISDEHADLVKELLRRKTACSQLYARGFDAGCVLVG